MQTSVAIWGPHTSRQQILRGTENAVRHGQAHGKRARQERSIIVQVVWLEGAHCQEVFTPERVEWNIYIGDLQRDDCACWGRWTHQCCRSSRCMCSISSSSSSSSSKGGGNVLSRLKYHLFEGGQHLDHEGLDELLASGSGGPFANAFWWRSDLHSNIPQPALRLGKWPAESLVMVVE